MAPVDLIISAPHMYTMTGKGLGYLAHQAMAVSGGKILDLGPAEDIEKQYTAERTIDAAHHLLLPGFIDAHMHMVDALMRGLAQDTRNWMMHGIGPFQMGMDEAGDLLGVQLAVAEGIAAGTTCFGEFSDYNPDIMAFLERSGVRSPVTIRVREAEERIYAPGELYEFNPEKGRKSLEHNLEAFDLWHGRGDGRITVLFGPQGPDFVSRELLTEVQRLAKERHTRIHMHVQQGDRETEQTMKRYGKRPITFLDEMGFLDRNLLAVHLTDAREDEAALVAERGASMILCSGSIGIIDGIVPPAKAFLDAGGTVALGSDQAPGNNCHNMFNEMKLTALFNKIRYEDPEVMPAWQVLKMATIDGARALGLDKRIGSLEPGKQADFIAVDLNTPSMAPVITDPMRNLVPNLVYSARGHEVSLVCVNGNILYENGKHTTIDLPEVLGAAGKYARDLGIRGTERFRDINGYNADLMRTGLL
ncbi:MAG: amidohydrolase family protein [Desulfobacterales bacterium]|nr:amidohydrolase family protein [Desulfobacterales bacterium]